MQKILEYVFEGEGLTRVFENEKWMVGIKNWKPMNDTANINNLERHNETDELFILLKGQCTLLYANETENGLKMKLILVEDSSTGSANSDNLDLTAEQIAEVHRLVKM